MAKVTKTKSSDGPRKKMRPALSPEARENQLIALAVDLVEQRLIDGTASSQETTHFLKLGSTKNQLEMAKLKKENELLQAKTENLQAQKDTGKAYLEALEAMKTYSGHGGDEDEEWN